MTNRVKNRPCKCGCGVMVTNDYARGHCHRMGFSHSEESKQKIAKSQTGKKFGNHTEETKKKISEAKKGSKWSDETREKIMSIRQSKKIVKEQKLCECGCGEMASPGKRFLPGHHHRCRTEETRRRFSEVRKGKKITEEHKEKLIASARTRFGDKHPMYGKHHTDETKRRISEIHTGRVRSEESKQNMSEALRLAWQDQENREKWLACKTGENHPMYGKHHSEETIQKMKESRNTQEYKDMMSEIKKEHWKDPKFSDAVCKGMELKPNKSEIMLWDLLNNLYPNEWKFVGDFSFMVNGKNPDFLNVNGKKLLIELFGDYWHRDDDPENRKDIFREFGYETLVIWESDLKKRPILTKRRIQAFVDDN